MKILLAILAIILLAITNSPSAQAINFPSGEIICGPNNSQQTECNMVYRPPGGSQGKRYIGSTEVRRYYNPINPTAFDPNPVVNEASTDYSNLGPYPTYNWNLGLPCGSVVGDIRNKNQYIIEPQARDGDAGSGAGNFSYSNAFAFHIQGITTPVLEQVAKPEHITWLPAVDNVLGNAPTDGRTLPACTLVHQTGTNDFYRLTGWMATDGRHESKKAYIGNNELLNLWLARTHFWVDADLSSYASATPVSLPPGLLVRTVDNPTIYFTDDNGYKQQIQSIEDFTALGFKTSGVRYVSQATLDSTPTAVLTP